MISDKVVIDEDTFVAIILHQVIQGFTQVAYVQVISNFYSAPRKPRIAEVRTTSLFVLLLLRTSFRYSGIDLLSCTINYCYLQCQFFFDSSSW